MDGDSSITTWLNRLKSDCDPAAADVLWRQYFERMVVVAKRRLNRKSTAARDEEDLALSAFGNFLQATKEGRFPALNDRNDLWRILFTMVDRKAINHVKRENRQKRGGGRVANAAALATDLGDNPLDQFAGAEPTPEAAAALTEEFARLMALLPDDDLRLIAMLKMEGHTHEEIAEKASISTRTVIRSLAVIRGLWQGMLSD